MKSMFSTTINTITAKLCWRAIYFKDHFNLKYLEIRKKKVQVQTCMQSCIKLKYLPTSLISDTLPDKQTGGGGEGGDLKTEGCQKRKKEKKKGSVTVILDPSVTRFHQADVTSLIRQPHTNALSSSDSSQCKIKVQTNSYNKTDHPTIISLELTFLCSSYMLLA